MSDGCSLSDGGSMCSPLEGCRVLDLCSERGLFCGMLMGCLGADVIKIEAPGGDRARNTPPFAGDTRHPERSLYWSAYNLNKRSITLNLEASIGRDLLRRLVEKADFVLESFAPGYLEKLGLDYPSLRRINQRLIMTSITPFGQTGPYSKYKSSDIVSMAMGGMMFLCGDPDRPPVRISFPQSYLLGSAHAEVGECYNLGWPAQLSKTPAQLKVAPCLGQDNYYVCHELLGMPDEEIVFLINEGILQT